MTRDEILSEISRLKEELRNVNDNINDAIRSLPEARRTDQRERKERLRYGSPPVGTTSYVSIEQNTETFISEYRQKRDDLKAKIEDLKSQFRSQSNPSSDPPRTIGVVKWYNVDKNFGFIMVDGQPDVFVPKSSLQESSALETGDKVTFKRVQGPKGFKAVDGRYVAE